jgi:copper chaperone CopZ
LESLKGIARWNVDTGNPDKVLTIQTDGITADEIIQKVQDTGFKIEQIVG